MMETNWPPDTPLDELPLSVRTSNCLRNAGCVYVSDVVSKSEGGLLSLPEFGRKSLNEIREVLAKGPPVSVQDLELEIERWRGRYEGAIEAISAIVSVHKQETDK